jgi:hypothetical protein
MAVRRSTGDPVFKNTDSYGMHSSMPFLPLGSLGAAGGEQQEEEREDSHGGSGGAGKGA